MVRHQTGKKIITSFIACMILSSSCAQADWQSWAQGNIQANVSGGQSAKTSLTTSLAGPELRVRWNSLGTINPIHATAPHMSAGCNGLDIGFGSLSFLNFDQLVEKLKAIAAAAPAFAFKMAIDTVCSQCSTIMNDIEAIVDKINNFSLDSCKAAQALGNAAGKAIGEGMNDMVSSGANSDFYDSSQQMIKDHTGWARDAYSATVGFFGGLKDGIEGKKMYGSLINNVVNQLGSGGLPLGFSSDQYKEMLRALVGDIIVYTQDGDDVVYPVPPGALTIDKLYEALVPMSLDSSVTITFDKVALLKGGSNIDGQENTGSGMPDEFQIIEDKFVANSTSAWNYQIKKQIDDVVDKIKNKSDITGSIAVLSSMPANGALFVNMAYLNKGTTADSLNYASYTATVYLRSQLLQMLSTAQDNITKYRLKFKAGQGDEQKIKNLDIISARIVNTIKEVHQTMDKDIEKHRARYEVAMVKEKNELIRKNLSR